MFAAVFKLIQKKDCTDYCEHCVCVYNVLCVWIITAGDTKPSVSDGYNLTVDEGQDVQFICNSTGKPEPLFLWYRNGGALRVLDDR